MMTNEAAKAQGYASQDCSNSVSMGMKRLKARGCDNMISMNTDGSNPNPGAPSDGSCSLYHPNGGGVKPCDVTAPSPSDPCLTGALGTSCSDGAFYIGTIGGNRIYAAAADITPTLSQWKTANTSTAGTTSTTDGLANTDAMIAADAAAHVAANRCRLLGAQWYLPARDELRLIWDNRLTLISAGAPMPLPTLGYWSSTQINATTARAISLGTGTLQNPSKNLNRYVRCVRQ